MVTEHYKKMRIVMGVLVILLPIAPLLFSLIGINYNPINWWDSISATYYTNANGIMVANLAICSYFFCTYPGYDWRDRLVNLLSGICLAGIILFPCGDENLGITNQVFGLFCLSRNVSSIIHTSFAICLFIHLFINVEFLFTKTKGEMTKKKKIRNLIYRLTGLCIIPGAAIFIALTMIWPATFPHWFILIAEAVALIPCGFSWLVKAEAIKPLND